MQPVQITVRDVPSSPVLEDHIHKKVDKLSHFCQRINSCRIVITLPQKHKHQGKLYCVRIDLTVPGKELVVNRKLNEDVYIAIRDAFAALQRQLENYSRIRKGHVKTHQAESKGHIKRLFPTEGYGFIQSLDGMELYFSVANMTHTDFMQLRVGDAVVFTSIPANDGWQANHVIKLKNNKLEEVYS